MKRAILIASSDFAPDSGLENLKFPPNDVKAMEVALSAEDFDFEVSTLINEDSSTVIQRLHDWVAQAHYDDLALIYFSGHGKLNRAGDLFLSCQNTTESRLLVTSLKYKDLMELIAERSLQKVVVLLDCCYAGRAVLGVKGATRGAVEGQVRAALSQDGHGHFFLGASGANQTAEERESDGHGRFTKQVIEGLMSGAADADNDGQISAKDLATYVKAQLRRQNAAQEPIEGGKYQGELILGSNKRKQLGLSISAIQTVVHNTREHFRRETFRKIEDYLDEIRNTNDLQTVLNDPRYLMLKRYSLTTVPVEEVATAFWSQFSSGRAVDDSGDVAEHRITQADSGGQSRAEPLQQPDPEKPGSGEVRDTSVQDELPGDPFKAFFIVMKRHSADRVKLVIENRNQRKSLEQQRTIKAKDLTARHRLEWANQKNADKGRFWVTALVIGCLGIVLSFAATSPYPLLLAIGVVAVVEFGIRWSRRTSRK